MASTYKRVRLGQAKRLQRSAQVVRNWSTGAHIVGSALALTRNPAAAAVGMGIIGLGWAGVGLVNMVRPSINKAARQRAGVAMLVERSQRAKTIARARGVLAKTAASRSAAASRAIVPRPVGQRRAAASQKGGDGSTEGYYRSQAGKRVFVRGYSTPSR